MKNFSAENIEFSHPGAPLFKGASLKACSGSITGLLGSNGSGKTTFFDLICGLNKVSAGSLHCQFDKCLYLSQSISTPPSLRMFDIFKMIVSLSSSKALTQEQVLQKLHIWSPRAVERYTSIWNKKSALCSYGEKRWFFTLSLLAVESEFIVLDEPTAGVDPEFRYYIWECLLAAAREGAAILVSSHSIEEIATYCSRFYMIHKKAFVPFDSASQYLERFGGTTLDMAFIAAGRE